MSSAAAVDRLRDDLHCLQCNYSLRGLTGDVVRCPECGLVHDVAQIVARKWDRPWYRAPGFNSLVLPLAWLTIAGMSWMLLLAFDAAQFQSPFLSLSIAAAAVVLLVWLWLLLRTRRLLTIASGPWLAMLAHAIFAGYLAAIFLIMQGLMLTAWSFPTLQLIAIVVGAAVVAAGCALFWIGRRCERYIAAVCIRQYLLGRP